ncbi:MAG TPA: PqiC family protein [Methylophilus sp.]
MPMITTRYCSLLASLLALSLSACLSVHKPVQAARYSLPETPAQQARQPSARLLVLAPVKLADYLDSDRIVLQLDEVTLRPTRDHLWADSLSQQLDRALHDRLSQRLPGFQVTRLSAKNLSAPILRIRIDQFQGHTQGYAVLSGEWQLDPQQAGRPFRFNTPLTENGYPALVRALGHTLDQLADSIAQSLQSADTP